MKRNIINLCMGAPKGNNNNPAGRPKGTPNKVAREIKEKLTYFLEAAYPTMIEAYSRLSNEEQVRYFEKIMPYVIPKNAAISFELEDPTTLSRPSWLKSNRAILHQDTEDIDVRVIE